MISIIRLLLTTLLLLQIISAHAAENIQLVTGKITIHLPASITATTRYQLILTEETAVNQSRELSRVGPLPVFENKAMPFSLGFSATEFKPQHQYFVIVKLTKKKFNTSSELMVSSFQVLTQGHPSELNIAISVPPDPVE